VFVCFCVRARARARYQGVISVILLVKIPGNLIWYQWQYAYQGGYSNDALAENVCQLNK
jgi:hypothetical protein